MERKEHDISFCFDRVVGITKDLMEGHLRQVLKEHSRDGITCRDEMRFHGCGIGETSMELTGLEPYLGGTEFYIIGTPAPEKERTRAALYSLDDNPDVRFHVYEPIDNKPYERWLVFEFKRSRKCLMAPVENNESIIWSKARAVNSINCLKEFTGD